MTSALCNWVDPQKCATCVCSTSVTQAGALEHGGTGRQHWGELGGAVLGSGVPWCSHVRGVHSPSLGWAAFWGPHTELTAFEWWAQVWLRSYVTFGSNAVCVCFVWVHPTATSSSYLLLHKKNLLICAICTNRCLHSLHEDDCQDGLLDLSLCNWSITVQ